MILHIVGTVLNRCRTDSTKVVGGTAAVLSRSRGHDQVYKLSEGVSRHDAFSRSLAGQVTLSHLRSGGQLDPLSFSIRNQ